MADMSGGVDFRSAPCDIGRMEPGEYALMDAAEGRMWWYRALHARLVGALAGVRGPLLDAGCGTGGLLARLRGAHADLHGLEFSPLAAPLARAKSGASIVRGSVMAMPYADASFAAVVSADVLCHGAVDPPAALAEMRRVLRPGGLLVLNLPSYPWLLGAHDRRVHNVRRFTAGGARALVTAAGFAGVRTRYWNSLLLPLMIAQRKLLARGDDAASDVAPFSPWLDATLHGITRLERRLPALPFGGSLLLAAHSP
jgi:SAM-dependent methyltransferase